MLVFTASWQTSKSSKCSSTAYRSLHCGSKNWTPAISSDNCAKYGQTSITFVDSVHHKLFILINICWSYLKIWQGSGLFTQSSMTTGSVPVTNDRSRLHGRRAACFKRTPAICRRCFLQHHTLHRCVHVCVCEHLYHYTLANSAGLGKIYGWGVKAGTTNSTHSTCGLTHWVWTAGYPAVVFTLIWYGELPQV